MRPYFPTEVEGKDGSSKLMLMVSTCYNVVICRIQVKDKLMSLLKYPIIVPYLFQNVQWAACHKEIKVACNYKIYAEEN